MSPHPCPARGARPGRVSRAFGVPPRRGGGAWCVAIAALLLLTSGCDTSQPEDTAHTLHVLAGSELKDIVPLLSDVQKSSGYTVQLTYTGSLDGPQSIVSGDTSDLAWFSSGNYLSLLEGKSGRIIAQHPIMLSPVVLGVKHSVAQSLGWSGSTS